MEMKARQLNNRSWREAGSDSRGVQAAARARSSRELADVEREDPDPHFS